MRVALGVLVAGLAAVLAAVAVRGEPAAADEPPEAQEAAVATEAPKPNTVTAYGAAPDLGPTPATSYAAPLVGVDGTPDGTGYWLAGEDGGVFTFGSARFHGSAGGIDLARPVVGIAAHPDGDGYWLVAADGGVFSYGSAPFLGSMGGRTLNEPIVGMAAHPDGDGYWLVAADGGVFTFGDAPFLGSEGGADVPYPIIGMTASPDGHGYWLAGRGGNVYPHGVTDHGSAAEHGAAFSAPTVGLAAHGRDGYWLVHGAAIITEVEDHGPHVRALQQRLAGLGYWVGPADGIFGDLTEQAVYAFQKYEGLAVTGEVDNATRSALAAAQRPVGRSDAGDVIEVDKGRQLLLFVRDGTVLWAFNTSTGTDEPYTYEGVQYLADTPSGRWQVYRQVDGYRTSNLGRLYRPKYFHRDGIAIHGYPLVPPRPASHGCVRVANAAIDHIWAHDLAPISADVWVYGDTPST